MTDGSFTNDIHTNITDLIAINLDFFLFCFIYANLVLSVLC
jgi:hypothetical protein